MKPSTKYIAALTVVLSVYASPVLAIGKRDITITTAENGVQLSLSKGYGVVLNLSTIGQTVSTAWLSDPSQITVASNKGPCTGDACAGSSVLYLKPIDKLNFPGLLSSSDGGSVLWVVTNSGQVLQFKLSVVSAVPTYTNVAVIPPLTPINPPKSLQFSPVPKPEPEIIINLPKTEVGDIKSFAQLTTTAKKTVPTKEIAKTDERAPLIAVLDPINPTQPPINRTNQEIALALLRGLHSPQGRAEVGRQSTHYRKAQDVISLLKGDAELPLNQAIAQVQMDEQVAQTLIRYGAR